MSTKKPYLWLDAGSTGYTTTVTFSASAMPSPSISSAIPTEFAQVKETGAQLITVPPSIKMYPVRTNLPEGHLIGIARIMVEWSLQEWLLQQILYELTTGGDPKIGRLSISFPRSEDAVNRIEQLTQVRNIELKADIAAIKRACKRLEAYRDQVGHGLWVVDDAARWCVVVYKGNWEAGEWQGTPKRVTPHAKPIDEADLAKHLDDIRNLGMFTRRLALEVQTALDASPDK